MNHKMFTYIFLAIALIVGVLSLISQNTFAIAAITSRFFEIMIPILGIAALCKYIMSCSDSKCMNNKTVVYIFMAIALIVGVLSLINQNTFAIAAITSRFFEIMVPVLGISALCKYLMCCKD